MRHVLIFAFVYFMFLDPFCLAESSPGKLNSDSSMTVEAALSKYEAFNWLRMPFEAQLSIAMNKDNAILATSEASIQFSGQRYMIDCTVTYPKSDREDDSDPHKMILGSDGKTHNELGGSNIQGWIGYIYPIDSEKQFPVLGEVKTSGLWALGGAITPDRDSISAILRRNQSSLLLTETGDGDQRVLELAGKTPEGDYKVSLSPAMNYAPLKLQCNKRQQDGHFKKLGESGSKYKERSYQIDFEYGSSDNGYRLTRAIAETSDNHSDGVISKNRTEIVIKKLEPVKQPISDETFKIQWPVGAKIFDYASGTGNDYKELLVSKDHRVSEAKTLPKGQKAPDFTALDMNGKKVRLADFRGKFVFLDVWATWCSACKSLKPNLETWARDLKNENIVFVSVSIDSKINTLKRYLENDKDSLLTNLWCEGGLSSEMRSYQITGYPFLILLDPDGNIAAPDITSSRENFTATELEMVSNPENLDKVMEKMIRKNIEAFKNKTNHTSR